MSINSVDTLEQSRQIYDRFLQLWNNERYSPVVLPREQSVLDAVKEYLIKSQDSIYAHEKMHRDALHLHMERLQFVLEDYIRLRLSKLSDNPSLYIHTDLKKYLTKNEVIAAQGLLDLSNQLLEDAIFEPVRAMIPRHSAELDPRMSFQKELGETFNRQLVVLRNRIVIARFLEATILSLFDVDTTVTQGEQLAVQFGAVEEQVIKGTVLLIG